MLRYLFSLEMKGIIDSGENETGTTKELLV
jgi:hypothetical protein